MMRWAAALLIALAGCQPPTASAPPAPRLPSDPANPGQHANDVFEVCLAAAAARCGAGTIYCTNYRRGYVRACMLENNVAPEYVLVLLGT